MLKQKVKDIKSKKLPAVNNLLSFSKQIATPKTKDLNIFLSLNETAIQQAKAIDKRIKEGSSTGKLAGLCFAAKSNISVKELETSCASKVLQGYVSAYNATVINKLLAEDAILIGMVNMDEFACGASGETSFFGPTKNPTNPDLIPGGSSSGSAAAVAANLCDFALGSDTGGSIRNPASHCGVTGLKPTYGAVSRYGLIDLSMSLDCIGPIAKKAEDTKLIFDIIKGQDNFDTTTNNVTKPIVAKNKTIGLVNVKNFCDERIANLIKEKTTQMAKKNNWKIKEINLPLDIAIQTYYILVYVEFFSSTRKFDGRRFGKKIETAAGPEVQRRIIGGSEVTKAEHEGRYYSEALKAKNFIKAQFEKLFSQVDVIILPTVPRLPHKIGEEISLKDMYNYDILTSPASLAEIPAMSVPAGRIEEKEVGIQIMTPHSSEELLFKIAKDFE